MKANNTTKRKFTKRRLEGLRPPETPAEGRARMVLARKTLVQRKSFRKILTSFPNKLLSVSSTNIKNGLIKILTDGSLDKAIRSDFESRRAMLNCHLFFGETTLAHARIGIGVSNGRMELVIEQIQGHTTALREYRYFKEANLKSWNVALVQTLIDTAYESGFDRVLFRDIETSFDYKAPHVIREGETIKSTKIKMRALYRDTKAACDFTKDEWIGPAHYWMREFP